MKRNVDGILLMEGAITRVSFSAKNEKAVICFDNGFEAEFRNAKKNRADHVRKLQLMAGERVIVIGAHSEKNPLYVFGFDVQRNGRLQNENYAIMKGQVKQLVRMKSACMLYVQEDRKQNIIKADPSLTKGIMEGDEITCICFQNLYQECIKPCQDWSVDKCRCCQNKQSDKRFTALELERRIS